MRPFRFSLTVTALGAVSLVVVATWSLLSIISVRTAERDFIAQKKDESRLLVRGISGLTTGDSLSPLRSFIEAAGEDDNSLSVLLADERGLVLFAFPEAKGGEDPRLREVVARKREIFLLADGSRELVHYSPLSIAGGRGAVRITLPLYREADRTARLRQTFLAYFVLDFVLLLIIGGFILSRLVVVPVRRLLTATQKITAGDLSHRVIAPGSVEIAELAESFNLMVHALREKREEVEQHVRSLEETNRSLRESRRETLRAEKLASIGVLAAGTAHEIGTPLAAVLGYQELLAEEPMGDPEHAEYVRRLGDEAKKIDRIIRGLLDFARPRETSSEPVDLRTLVRDTVDLLNGQGWLKQATVSVAEEPAIPFVMVDRYQLQQVFLNLLINARDAMPDGGEIRISFASGAEHAEEWVRICFADTGEGIPQENLARIFDPFFTTKEPGKGTGLGLAISLRIVESLGGTLSVESVPGTGSSFFIELPALQGEK